ncbi:hypothetical protein [Cellulomonas sp. APG4]|uniref:hypothetical protein n=1 Tax=Cellulomonas sp. APG4 TaxID=1538656 RepID=UPI001ED93A6F|nr:hypothetical protein [Cellulomonas sp. APG4]
MGYDLGAGLRRLSDSADLPTAPVEPDDVVRSVRRRRAVRTGLTAGLGTAAVLALAVAVQAAPWATQDPPPAAPTPTHERTIEPAPEESESPEPEEETESPPTVEDEPEPPPPPPALGLTVDGHLVELDPGTGEVLRTVREAAARTSGADAWSTWDLAVDRERGVAYVADGQWEDARIQRVDLATGAAETLVTSGWSPAVSPDGVTLAYIGPPPGGDGQLYGLNLLDLATGEVRHVPDDTCTACERVFGSPAWSSDGTEVHVVAGWFDSPYATEVLTIDVVPGAESASVEAGAVLGPTTDTEEWGVAWNRVASLGDGRLLVAGQQGAWDDVVSPGEAGYYDADPEPLLAVVDEVSGEVLHEVVPSAPYPRSLSGDPSGPVGLYVDAQLDDDDPGAWTFALTRWDVGSGPRVLSTGIVAVDW